MEQKKPEYGKAITKSLGLDKMGIYLNDGIAYYMRQSYYSFTCKPFEEQITGILWAN